MCEVELWCPKESRIQFFLRIKRFMVRAMCRIQLNYRKRAKVMMLMLSLDDTIDQLAMANSAHWHGHVLRRERTLEFEVEGQ